MSPDFTVLWKERLVAYVWVKDGGGKMLRGGDMTRVLCDVPWAEIHVFDPKREAFLAELVPKSGELAAWLFKLKLDAYRVEPGKVSPNFGSRGF